MCPKCKERRTDSETYVEGEENTTKEDDLFSNLKAYNVIEKKSLGEQLIDESETEEIVGEKRRQYTSEEASDGEASDGEASDGEASDGEESIKQDILKRKRDDTQSPLERQLFKLGLLKSVNTAEQDNNFFKLLNEKSLQIDQKTVLQVTPKGKCYHCSSACEAKGVEFLFPTRPSLKPCPKCFGVFWRKGIREAFGPLKKPEIAKKK